jgi:hypothetical protein
VEKVHWPELRAPEVLRDDSVADDFPAQSPGDSVPGDYWVAPPAVSHCELEPPQDDSSRSLAGDSPVVSLV